MPLACGCSDDYDWFFYPPTDYSVFQARRRKRCSCGSLIEHGATCLEFDIYRAPKSDIEERIHGEEVPMAPKYLCERCADLYFSFTELGYDCVQPEESMLELAADYADSRPNAVLSGAATEVKPKRDV